jgi:hypothetical protein
MGTRVEPQPFFCRVLQRRGAPASARPRRRIDSERQVAHQNHPAIQAEPRNPVHMRPAPLGTAFPVSRFGSLVTPIGVDDASYPLTVEERRGVIAGFRREEPQDRALGDLANHRWDRDGIELKLVQRLPRQSDSWFGLHAALEFDEIVLRLNQALVTCRACVIFAPVTVSNRTPKTQFWTRFILATHPNSINNNKQARNLRHVDIREFINHTTILSQIMTDSMISSYGSAISLVVRKELKTQVTDKLSILAVGTHHQDFAEFFRAALEGKRLSQAVTEHPTAFELVKLGYRILSGEDGELPAPQAMISKLPQNIKFELLDRPRGEQGMFLSVSEAGTTRLVGIAQIPMTFEPSLEGDSALTGLSQHSANVVATGISAEYVAKLK